VNSRPWLFPVRYLVPLLQISDCRAGVAVAARSLSDIAVRDEAQEVRPDARPQRAKRRRRTLRYVELLSEARTKLADFFSILLEEAMTVSVVWGLTLLAVLSPLLARAQQIPAWKVIA
jgi:hypothetical protein